MILQAIKRPWKNTKRLKQHILREKIKAIIRIITIRIRVVTIIIIRTKIRTRVKVVITRTKIKMAVTVTVVVMVEAVVPAGVALAARPTPSLTGAVMALVTKIPS